MGHTARRARVAQIVLWLAVLAVAVLLTVDGRIDHAVSGLFYRPGAGFPARIDPLIAGLRHTTRLTAIGIGACLVFALIYRTLLDRPLLGLSRADIVYLAAVFLLVPGLVVNGVLKDYWGRARPAQTIMFGGDKHYTPPLLPADQCERNCSFVSGEASLGFAFVAFGLVARRRSRRRFGLGAGLVLGGLFGLMRIAQGGHFLSDVFFAGVITVVLAWLLHVVLIERGWLDRIGRRVAPGRNR